jgi:predicted ATPase
VLLLGTYREVELDEALPLHETLLELTSRRLGRRVKLERLDREKTRDLLAVIFAEEITPDFLERIYRETEGNPFFVEEVSKSLVESGQVWYEGGEWQRVPRMEDISIPQGVKVAIQSRVSKLTDDTQGILLTGAVIGREFDYQTLAIVSGKDEDTLIDSLEEGISKQLIEEMRIEGEERFSFSHALISATLRESISGLRRTRLHRQVAKAIEELHPEDFERLAYHWGEAGVEEKGLDYTIKAAERARQAYANEDAVRMYTEALSLISEDDPYRFELLSGRAEVYNVIAERESQLADLEAMLRMAKEQRDESRQIDALLALANFYLWTEMNKAREPADKALAIARDLGDIAREGRVLCCLGYIALNKFANAEAAEYFEIAAKYLEKAGLTREMIECFSNASVVMGNMGDASVALETAQKTVDLSREAGDKLLEAISRRRLAIAYMAQYRYAEAMPIAEAALTMFREVGDITGEIHAQNVVAIIKHYLGRIEEAEKDFLEALQVSESIVHNMGIRVLVNNLSEFYPWYFGELEKPLALVQEHVEKAKLVVNESLVKLLRENEARLLYHLGEYELALNIAKTILPGYEKIRDKAQKGWLLSFVGVLYAEVGQFEQASQYLEIAKECCSGIKGEYTDIVIPINYAQAAVVEGENPTLHMGLEKAKGAVNNARELNLIRRLGWALLVKANLHLALLEEDRSHAEAAIKSTEEVMKVIEIDHPVWIMPEHCLYLHACALRVNGREEEADEYLRQAYERVMMVAENISDEDLRRSYLENVRVNRAIQATYRERFG